MFTELRKKARTCQRKRKGEEKVKAILSWGEGKREVKRGGVNSSGMVNFAGERQTHRRQTRVEAVEGIKGKLLKKVIEE